MSDPSELPDDVPLELRRPPIGGFIALVSVTGGALTWTLVTFLTSHGSGPAVAYAQSNTLVAIAVVGLAFSSFFFRGAARAAFSGDAVGRNTLFASLIAVSVAIGSIVGAVAPAAWLINAQPVSAVGVFWGMIGGLAVAPVLVGIAAAASRPRARPKSLVHGAEALFAPLIAALCIAFYVPLTVGTIRDARAGLGVVPWASHGLALVMVVTALIALARVVRRRRLLRSLTDGGLERSHDRDDAQLPVVDLGVGEGLFVRLTRGAAYRERTRAISAVRGDATAAETALAKLQRISTATLIACFAITASGEALATILARQRTVAAEARSLPLDRLPEAAAVEIERLAVALDGFSASSRRTLTEVDLEQAKRLLDPACMTGHFHAACWALERAIVAVPHRELHDLVEAHHAAMIACAEAEDPRDAVPCTVLDTIAANEPNDPESNMERQDDGLNYLALRCLNHDRYACFDGGKIAKAARSQEALYREGCELGLTRACTALEELRKGPPLFGPAP